MTLIRLVARPMLASMFVVGGINALRNPQAMAPAAKPVTDAINDAAEKVAPQVPLPKEDVDMVRLNGAIQVVAGLGLATGRFPRLCALALAGSTVPTTVAGHRFWEADDAQSRQQQQIHFFKNVSMLGGLLLAAVDTEGKPGVAWRAQHAVGDARREARQVARATKAQAKVARGAGRAQAKLAKKALT
jgi:putative oxidoreductase